MMKKELYKNRSKISAGIMQLFCGCFGLGRFYLGDKKIGIFQILVTVVTLGVGGVIWGFVDGSKILEMCRKRG